MTTVVRDFSSPDGAPARASTLLQPGEEPRSPVPQDHPDLDRRGSVASRASNTSFNNTGLRNRKVSRANTITTSHEPEHPNWQPGSEPGIDTKADDDNLPIHLSDLKADCEIRVIDYSDSDFMENVADNDTLAELLEHPRPEELPCRWISVNGLSWDVIRILGNKFNLHRLAIEDLIHLHTRTKVDWYADHAFIVMTLQKLVRLHQHDDRSDGSCDCPDSPNEKSDLAFEGAPRRHRKWWSRGKKMTDDVLPQYDDNSNRTGKLDEFISAHIGISEKSPIRPIRTLHRYESSQVPEHTAWMERHSLLAQRDHTVSVEQVSIFLLADNCVISFFEQSAEDVETPIMERLRSRATILRRSMDASLLTQALIDTIVDLAVPVKDAYNEARKHLQIAALISPDIRTSRALHIFGEEIDMLQNLFQPVVHLVNALRDHNPEPVQANGPAVTDSADGASAPPYPGTPQPDARPPTRSRRGDRDGTPAFGRTTSDFKRLALKRSAPATSVTISPLAHVYFGDVLDHCITMITSLEQMDASATNISTLIFNTVGARTNNFMMILAVVTVFFSPLTFISGYFGMNFAGGAGLDHPFAFFWLVAIPSLIAFMLLVFGVMFWDGVKDMFDKRYFRARMVLGRKHKRY